MCPLTSPANTYLPFASHMWNMVVLKKVLVQSYHVSFSLSHDVQCLLEPLTKSNIKQYWIDFTFMCFLKELLILTWLPNVYSTTFHLPPNFHFYSLINSHPLIFLDADNYRFTQRTACRPVFINILKIKKKRKKKIPWKQTHLATFFFINQTY